MGIELNKRDNQVTAITGHKKSRPLQNSSLLNIDPGYHLVVV
jgi:hypothetical protein